MIVNTSFPCCEVLSLPDMLVVRGRFAQSPPDDVGVFMLLCTVAAAAVAMILMEQGVSAERRVSRSRVIGRGRTIGYASGATIIVLWAAYARFRVPTDGFVTLAQVAPRFLVPGIYLAIMVVSAIAGLKFWLVTRAQPRTGTASRAASSYAGLVVAMINLLASIVTLLLFGKQFLSGSP